MRVLRWEGLSNTRDLGGLPSSRGIQTKWKSIIRSDTPENLSRAGWCSALRYGVRTVIDLRGGDEHSDLNFAQIPSGVHVINLPLEDRTDFEFWGRWDRDLDTTPAYYSEFLRRSPDAICDVLSTISKVKYGAILVHCQVGRDRTGLISLLLLALARVPPQSIARDYELSPRPKCTLAKNVDLNERENMITELVESLDIDRYLSEIGLTRTEIFALKNRL